MTSAMQAYDQYDALIFDMDGTLVDSGQVHEQAWKQALNKHHIPIDAELMRSLAGVPTVQTVERLIQYFQLQSDIQPVLVAHDKAQFAAELAPKYLQATKLKEVVLHYAGRKPMALGTGALSGEAQNILKLLKLDQYFPVIVGGDNVSKHKPAPDTFLLCAEKLQVEASKCVVFEDSVLGLEAGRAAGMSVIDVALDLDIHNDYFL
ncbi:beta-phosphoglucomutase family hydrolase [Agaribacterium sp. ZY112]|uniref:beta-phosphoglucomutase family hydrolase n=1 Tax=Agaribacterium sp. ZY112 TaxID=3233574 RepID=UPI0035254141